MNNNKNTINTIIELLKEIVIFVYQLIVSITKGLFKIIKVIYDIIPKKVRIVLSIIIATLLIGIILFFTFRENLYLKQLDYRIHKNENLLSKSNIKVLEGENDLKDHQQLLFLKIKTIILEKQNSCIQENIVKTLKKLRSKEEGVQYFINDRHLYKKLKNVIVQKTCSISEIEKKEYDNIIIGMKLLFDIGEEDINYQFEKLKIEEKKKTVEKIDGEYDFLEKEIGNEEEPYEGKMKNKEGLKALFCVYGHGMSSKFKGVQDNGYIISKSDYSDEEWKKLGEYVNKYAFEYIKNEFNNNGLITERGLIEMVNISGCEKLRKYSEEKNIKFYEIGRKELISLKDKIELINKISEENGYDQLNSIVYELHSNSVQRSTKSGIEVFHSGFEQKNNGMQGRDLALTILKSVAPFHKKHSKIESDYVVKRDGKSKHSWLGMTSKTKPLGILIEYGFKKNLNDVTIMLEHHQEIGKTIADGVINFIS